ncbi:MAG: copper-binding protein [Thiobacillus sp.]|nr:copper-binding protein [Thiobacillus sp.]
MKRILLMTALLTVNPALHAEPIDAVSPSPAQLIVMSEGIVKKIDPGTGKITLKHGAIVNLDMPAMTMVFRVQPPSLLNAVKVSDTVKFHAERINGALTVTAIQVTP